MWKIYSADVHVFSYAFGILMWFHLVPIVLQEHKRLFFRSQTFTAGVVHAWFHVVLIVPQQHNGCFLLEMAQPKL